MRLQTSNSQTWRSIGIYHEGVVVEEGEGRARQRRGRALILFLQFRPGAAALGVGPLSGTSMKSSSSFLNRQSPCLMTIDRVKGEFTNRVLRASWQSDPSVPSILIVEAASADSSPRRIGSLPTCKPAVSSHKVWA